MPIKPYERCFTVIEINFEGALLERLTDGHRLTIKGEKVALISAQQRDHIALSAGGRADQRRANERLDRFLAIFFDCIPEASGRVFGSDQNIPIRRNSRFR